ncbi:hypothetical protein NDS46_31480 (plasmid) [Paenibacillus thiaminolyticus]|uniref:hypothetical protein n=1 Tax=Paenibacillus thiaminolyticus TaxID=49283 RepID=UPI00232C5815|nr:hypothetical protein [Paenibacillus thiaminolyticus]WCF11480.1 hypothetical protein NDS46_31480 [Paenibacillus thiaminolyticus]
METLNTRFRKLEGTLAALVQQYQLKRLIEDEKKAVAKEMIGCPYYWGEYSGVIEAHKKDSTKVVARLIHQKTGSTCYWDLDPFHILEHFTYIQKFESWGDFHLDEMLRWAEAHEKMLNDFGYSKEKIKKEMQLYCKKFSIPYKSYEAA